ncbi:hypothetical protein [Kitasatospora sp. GP82]|uniref:hypothetical protein n=1 Tax=Kitasatospora sp. GP82 TaxID=3035089 RepID=UPI002473F2E6|nr:hypothetical protein [Kitasatospora sp. GP82]MDH6127437.1 hypothetical protein [Kitasatospora sp. GP82]
MTITCPADFGGTDWSTTTQILALGTPDGENTAGPNGTTVLTQTSLLAVINGQLWLFPPGASTARLLKPVDREVSTANTWGNYDLIGPGPANGNNQPTLWARDKVAGTIHAYPLTKNADGTVNYSALADPTTGTIANTGGVYPATFPTVGSSGDITGDGIPDLWAVTADGKLVVWPGQSVDGTPHTAVNNFSARATLADLRAPLGHWRLNDVAGSTTAADTTGQHPLTVQGAAFGSDTVNGKPATVAAFNGSSSTMTAGGSIIDTTQSFTVTAWAKATASGGVVISQDGTNASGLQLWPSNIGGGRAEWKFGMAASDAANLDPERHQPRQVHRQHQRCNQQCEPGADLGLLQHPGTALERLQLRPGVSRPAAWDLTRQQNRHRSRPPARSAASGAYPVRARARTQERLLRR